MTSATCQSRFVRFPRGTGAWLPGCRVLLPCIEYDLSSTLTSGQAFRWRVDSNGNWTGVVGRRWVRLRQEAAGIAAEVVQPVGDWSWLASYLGSEDDLEAVLETFPGDDPMSAATAACRGLRLLRQDPWECLASFLLSSTKQIVQIEQIIELLCERFGTPVEIPEGLAPAYAFPEPRQLASATESELRACKMGFRAPYLLAVARAIASGEFPLHALAELPEAEARAQLTTLPGVGPKIANCVLLFALGFQKAFPVDVWVRKALEQLYFPRRRPSPARLRRFVANHFGPCAGYAQQYLFHYMRVHNRGAR